MFHQETVGASALMSATWKCWKTATASSGEVEVLKDCGGQRWRRRRACCTRRPLTTTWWMYTSSGQHRAWRGRSLSVNRAGALAASVAAVIHRQHVVPCRIVAGHCVHKIKATDISSRSKQMCMVTIRNSKEWCQYCSSATLECHLLSAHAQSISATVIVIIHCS